MSLYGQPQGRVNGTDYRDDPDIFRAKLTAISSGKAGFQERWQRPDTGALENKPDGRQGSTSVAWVVLPSGSSYAVDDEVLLRTHQRDSNLYEIVAGGGGGSGYIVVRPTANGAGDGTYVDAVIQQRNATTGAWEDGVETVSFRPYWTGMKQKQNLLWRCEDTGVRDGEDQRQVEGIIAPLIARQVMVEWKCTSATTTKTYATVWVPDVL